MTEENRNPEGTGAEGEGQESQTPQTPKENQEGQDPKLGEGEQGAQGKENEAVFGGEEQPNTMFKSLEDAEKSYKESQKYIAKLQEEIKTKEASQKADPQPADSNLMSEIKMLKAELKMNQVFDNFAEEHPDFKGSLRTEARKIIATHIKAGETIKMSEAYHIAKAKLGVSDEEDVNRGDATKAAAGLSFGSQGGRRPSRTKVYEPTSKEKEFLDGLGLSPEEQAKVLARAAQ